MNQLANKTFDKQEINNGMTKKIRAKYMKTNDELLRKIVYINDDLLKLFLSEHMIIDRRSIKAHRRFSMYEPAGDK